MASKIQVLDDKTINQIAAGEVVENAASCVKELVENAIDAGATQVEVETQAGGRQRIVVIDNGIGMGLDDALLALERHATSKIRSIEDMNSIASMGFRGEALASIAAISRLIVHSSDGQECSKVTCHGGKIIDQAIAPRQQGTTIDISALFFNVPARKEFQKSIGYDNRIIHQTMTQLALAYPKVSFKLTQDQKVTFDLRPKMHFNDLENLKLRIQELFGSQLHEKLKLIESTQEGISLSGFIAEPTHHRPNRLGQYLFVNHRFVDSKLVSMAIREGYSTRLPEGRFPVFFLSLKIDPLEVDVNVHPQKKEIRFQKPFEIKRIVSMMVDQGLRAASVLKPPEASIQKEVFFKSEHFSSAPYKSQVQDIQVLCQEEPVFFPDASLEFVPNVVGLFKGFIFVEAQSIASQWSLKETEVSGLVLVHQRRAQECILYDQLTREQKKVNIQNLLIAETIEVSNHDYAVIEEYLPTFNEMGVSLRPISENSFILDGLPAQIPMSDVKNLIESVIEEVSLGHAKKTLSERRQEILAAAIAKAVSWKTIEQIDEARIMLTKLFQCQKFEFSPKGHPVLKNLTLKELAKKFKV